MPSVDMESLNFFFRPASATPLGNWTRKDANMSLEKNSFSHYSSSHITISSITEPGLFT